MTTSATWRAAAITAATLALLPLPAAAVNKCTGPDGAIVFQDAPCSGKGETLNIRPASGTGRAQSTEPAPANGGSSRPITEAQRIEQQIESSQKARRLQELEQRVVPDAHRAIDLHRQACDREIQSLRVSKNRANNNLAGATLEGAISGEMTAIATRCDTRNRELREDFDRLQAECRSLGGCK